MDLSELNKRIHELVRLTASSKPSEEDVALLAELKKERQEITLSSLRERTKELVDGVKKKEGYLEQAKQDLKKSVKDSGVSSDFAVKRLKALASSLDKSNSDLVLVLRETNALVEHIRKVKKAAMSGRDLARELAKEAKKKK